MESSTGESADKSKVDEATDAEETTIDEKEPDLCCICGDPDSRRKRLCTFLPSDYDTERIVIHVFCGRTAAILPHINRPDLEILTKAGIKNKYGTEPCVLVALQKSRTARIPVDETNDREQVYYLVEEFEKHLEDVLQHRGDISPPEKEEAKEQQPQEYKPQSNLEAITPAATEEHVPKDEYVPQPAHEPVPDPLPHVPDPLPHVPVPLPHVQDACSAQDSSTAYSTHDNADYPTQYATATQEYSDHHSNEQSSHQHESNQQYSGHPTCEEYTQDTTSEQYTQDATSEQYSSPPSSEEYDTSISTEYTVQADSEDCTAQPDSEQYTVQSNCEEVFSPATIDDYTAAQPNGVECTPTSEQFTSQPTTNESKEPVPTNTVQSNDKENHSNRLDSVEHEPPAKKIKELSPYEVAMERLTQASQNVGGVGYSLIRGVASAQSKDDYAEEDEETFDPKLCSQKQVDHVRVIIVTQARQEQMEHMLRLVTTSEKVMEAWRIFQAKYRNLKSWPTRFDMLVGFTDALKDYNKWMKDPAHDFMVAGLARLWKVLLNKSNEELGMDAEFTRPGVMTLLEQFRSLVEPAMEFRYQTSYITYEE